MKKTRSHIKGLLDSFLTDKQITGILFDTLLTLNEKEQEKIHERLKPALVSTDLSDESGEFDYAVRNLCSSVIFEDGSRLTRSEAKRLITCWGELCMLRNELEPRC